MGYNRQKKNMKKIFYLLIACTMMCFAGCEEKGDEIDNTTDTGENVEINEADLVGTWEFVSSVENEYDFVEDKWIDDYWYMYNSDKERWEELYDESGERYLSAFYEELYFFLTLNADKTYASKSLEKNCTYVDEADKLYPEEREYYFEDNGTWSLSKDGAFSLKMKKVYVKSTRKGETKEATFNSYEEYDKAYDNEGYYVPEFCSEWFCEENLEYDYDYFGIKKEDICLIKELTSTSLVIEIKPSDKTMEELKKLYKEKKEEDRIREALEDETERYIHF